MHDSPVIIVRLFKVNLFTFLVKPVCSLTMAIIIFFCLILTTGCEKTQEQMPVSKSKDDKPSVIDNNTNQNVQFVSMIDLITNPSKYDAKRVGVTGVLSVKFEDNALYFHKEDYLFGIPENAFSLELDESIINQYKHLQAKYVLVIGNFNAGRYGIFRGSINNIVSIQFRDSRDH